jgi:nucleotide-binding universal stress UspA family protein
MTETNRNVVVAFDFTPTSRPALRSAIALAGRDPQHILHFLCVAEPHHEVPNVPRHGPVDYAYAAQVQALLTDELTRELRLAGLTRRVQFFVHVRIGKPAAEILMLAREVGADLIIVGTKGLTGVEHVVLGSVAEKVVREAGCTVEIARPKTYPQVERLDVVEVEQRHHYVPPHRYTYEDRRLQFRPDDWPLY